jgi:hypothetical protein
VLSSFWCLQFELDILTFDILDIGKKRSSGARCRVGEQIEVTLTKIFAKRWHLDVQHFGILKFDILNMDKKRSTGARERIWGSS